MYSHCSFSCNFFAKYFNHGAPQFAVLYSPLVHTFNMAVLPQHSLWPCRHLHRRTSLTCTGTFTSNNCAVNETCTCVSSYVFTVRGNPTIQSKDPQIIVTILNVWTVGTETRSNAYMYLTAITEPAGLYSLRRQCFYWRWCTSCQNQEFTVLAHGHTLGHHIFNQFIRGYESGSVFNVCIILYCIVLYALCFKVSTGCAFSKGRLSFIFML